MAEPQKINIRPESGILAVLSHLNYRPWFAIAEFIDNSIQSYISNRKRIEAIDGAQACLEVTIKLDAGAGRIIIRDNAGGIAWNDFPRAFKPAQLPPDRSGLSEFGLGMKMAACWFAKRWHIRTSAVGENLERSIEFDVEEIQRTDVESLIVYAAPVSSNAHYTELVLERLNQGMPQKRTLGKLRDHLRSIYRCYTRDGLLKLYLESDFFGREELSYDERKVLNAPKFGSNKEPVNEEILNWRKDLQFEFGDGFKVRGFAGILEDGDTKRAGLALFRRRRLIVGSDDETYRPPEIFKGPNDYEYQRVFGEIHIEGMHVAHTKDGFRWAGFEEEFLEKLREAMNAEPVPLLRQADNFRKNLKKGSKETESLITKAEAAARSVQDAVSSSVEELSAQATNGDVSPAETEELDESPELVTSRHFEVTVSDCTWQIYLEFDLDPANGSLLEVANQAKYSGHQHLSYRVGLNHPFVRAFIGANQENIELISFLVTAIGLSEKTSQLGGVEHQAARMRVNISDVLRAMTHSRH